MCSTCKVFASCYFGSCYCSPAYNTGTLSDAAVRLSVCLSHAQSKTTVHYGYYRTLIENPMLEFEPTGQRCHIGYQELKW